MIEGFACRQTRRLFEGKSYKGLPDDLQRLAMRKLTMLHNARKLDDLRSPPSNRPEKLKGQRKGQYSIRINAQYRVCFRWVKAAAHDVEIVNYH